MGIGERRETRAEEMRPRELKCVSTDEERSANPKRKREGRAPKSRGDSLRSPSEPAASDFPPRAAMYVRTMELFSPMWSLLRLVWSSLSPVVHRSVVFKTCTDVCVCVISALRPLATNVISNLRLREVGCVG